MPSVSLTNVAVIAADELLAVEVRRLLQLALTAPQVPIPNPWWHRSAALV
jgi:hypothetical protein